MVTGRKQRSGATRLSEDLSQVNYLSYGLSNSEKHWNYPKYSAFTLLQASLISIKRIKKFFLDMPHISFLFTSAIVNKNQIIIIAMCWCDSTVFVFHCYCCLVLIVFWLLWLDIRFFCISLQIRKFLISIQNMSSYLWRWKALSCARCLRRNSLTFFFIIMLGMYNRNIANSYLALVAVLHKNWFEAFINT